MRRDINSLGMQHQPDLVVHEGTTKPFTSTFFLLPPANEVWGKVIFLHLFVILFTGGCLPQCMLGYHHPPGPCTPLDHAPPQTMHPPDHAHPLAQSMLGDTVNARAVRILLECNLVILCYCYPFFC